MSKLEYQRIPGTNFYQMKDGSVVDGRTGQVVKSGSASHSSGEVGRNGAGKVILTSIIAAVLGGAGLLTWLSSIEENNGASSAGLTGGGGEVDGLAPQIAQQVQNQTTFSGFEQLIIPSEYKRISSLSLDPHFATYEANMGGNRNIVHIFTLSDQLRLKILAGKKRGNLGGGDVLSFHSLRNYADTFPYGRPVFLFNAAPYILSSDRERIKFNQALSYPVGIYDKNGEYHAYDGFEQVEGNRGADDRRLLVNYGTAVECVPFQEGGMPQEYITLETESAEREGRKELPRTLIATGDSGKQLLVYVSTGRTKDKAFGDVRAFGAASHNIVMAGGGRDTQSFFAPNNEYIVKSPDDRLLPTALALYIPQ